MNPRLAEPQPNRLEQMLERKIWLLGDSYPANWLDVLNGPFDPRHPIRHNIWTPVFDRIQERVYRSPERRRVTSGSLFIWNAAGVQQPGAEPDWSAGKIGVEIARYRRWLEKYRPPIVISFGRRSYAFALAALSPAEDQPPDFANLKTSSRQLGDAFRKAVEQFGISRVNLIPLLHRSIAGRSWLTSGIEFTQQSDQDYFAHVGDHIGSLLSKYCDRLPIWVTSLNAATR